MKHFILNRQPDRDNTIRLEGDDYRYLVRVRRFAVGEFFPAVLPNGDETLVQVLSVDHGILTGKCNSADSVPQAALSEAASSEAKLPPIILFQALPKGEKMDLIVRQAAEGGITEIVPFVSEFSVVKMKAGGGQKFSRWERIIREARQQSGSMTATAIRRPVAIDGLFAYWEQIKAYWPGILGLLFHHLPLAKLSLHEYLDTNPEAVVLAIGPEGGFSPAEAQRFLAAGFKPLTIGNTVLRTETAALYAAAAVRILLLERDSWKTK